MSIVGIVGIRDGHGNIHQVDVRVALEKGHGNRLKGRQRFGPVALCVIVNQRTERSQERP